MLIRNAKLGSARLLESEALKILAEFVGKERKWAVATLASAEAATSASAMRDARCAMRDARCAMRDARCARNGEASATKTRVLTLNQYQDLKLSGKPTCSTPPTASSPRMLMLLNGLRWLEPVTEKPVLGDTEIWSFVNLTEDVHPVHLHLVRFQILDRQQFDVDQYLTNGKMKLLNKRVPPQADELGWKDTVRADPGLVTRIIVRFEGYVGRYVWHCHLLEHAANEMMRPYEVVARS